MNKEVLILGASGMVGSHFKDTYADTFDLLTPDEHELDLTQDDSLKAFFNLHPNLSAVVNLAAYTNVSAAQKQRGEGEQQSPCWLINVVGAKNLASVLENSSVYLIHISTDMVFPGNEADPGPYAESHLLHPQKESLTLYGYTKALAEQIFTDSLPGRLAILRLIYPVVKNYPDKPDYLRSPLAYYETNHSLYPIFTDQQVNITDVTEANQQIAALLQQRQSGIFHAGSSDISTPYRIMCQLFDLVYGHHDMVRPGLLAEFLKKTDDPTRYPMFGGLLNKQTQEKLGIPLSSSVNITDRLYRRP